MKHLKKFEVINHSVELNEDFLPNQNLTYTIEFDGVDRFRCQLEQENFDAKRVGVSTAPKTVHYTLDKPIEEFTDEEKETILDYRGLELTDGFSADDIFMEKSFITLDGIDISISMKVQHRIIPEAGESSEDLLDRTADIYLHGFGADGFDAKEDLGGDYKIKFI
jgi:hypothetical protein|tara:strand:+ start:62 stop:556 length:495 start_codon:yes stop_codon:yes gene_type:complete